MRPVEQFPRDLAHAIEPRNRNHVFVRGDLEDAVAGGVHDELAGAHVLFAEFFDDFGAGGGLVADRLAADLALKLGNQVARKTVRINRERLVQPDTGHFPMPGGRIFSRGVRCAFAEGAERCGGGLQISERSNIREAETQEIRDFQRARFGDMPQRAAADVAVIRRVRQFADSDAIEHDPNNSLKRGHHELRSLHPNSNIRGETALPAHSHGSMLEPIMGFVLNFFAIPAY